MRRIITIVASATIAALAFVQTAAAKTNNVKQEQPALTKMTAVPGQTGTVDSFAPGQSIRLQVSPIMQPVSYVLGKNVRYVDTAGRKIGAGSIGAGARVQLHFAGAANHRTVNRITLLSPE
jgi:hypothetical protein